MSSLNEAMDIFKTTLDEMTAHKDESSLRDIHARLQVFLTHLTVTDISPTGKATLTYATKLPNEDPSQQEYLKKLIGALHLARQTADKSVSDKDLIEAIGNMVTAKSNDLMGKTAPGTFSKRSPLAATQVIPNEPAATQPVSPNARLESTHVTSEVTPQPPMEKQQLLCLHRQLEVQAHLVKAKLGINPPRPGKSFSLKELLEAYAYNKTMSAWRTYRKPVIGILNELKNRPGATDLDYLQALKTLTRNNLTQQGTLALIIDYATINMHIHHPKETANLFLDTPQNIKTRFQDTLKQLKLTPSHFKKALSAKEEARVLLTAYAHPPLFSSNRHYKDDIAWLLSQNPEASAADYLQGVYDILVYHPQATPQGTLATMLKTLKDLAQLEGNQQRMMADIYSEATQSTDESRIDVHLI